MTCLGAIVEAEDCEIDEETGRPNGGDPSCLKACMTLALPQAVIWKQVGYCDRCLLPESLHDTDNASSYESGEGKGLSSALGMLSTAGPSD